MAGPKIPIPEFDNTTHGYKEFRKRVLLYKARMRLEGKEDQVGLSVLGSLTGVSWDACEHYADDIEALSQKDAIDKILQVLDARFLQEKDLELPDAFEEYFFKGNRNPRKRCLITFSEYVCAPEKMRSSR